jgi:hypothetical protein
MSAFSREVTLAGLSSASKSSNMAWLKKAGHVGWNCGFHAKDSGCVSGRWPASKGDSGGMWTDHLLGGILTKHDGSTPPILVSVTFLGR